MEKDKTKDKNLADVDKIFRNSDDLDIVMNRRSLDDAMNIIWSKVDEEQITDEDVKFVLKRDPEDINYITEDDFRVEKIGQNNSSEFSLEDVMSGDDPSKKEDTGEQRIAEGTRNTPQEVEEEFNNEQDDIVKNTDKNSGYDHLSLGSRVNGLEKAIYEGTTMRDAFGLYGYLWGILYIGVVYAITFLPSSVSVIPNLVNNQYTGVLVGLVVVGGLAVQQLLLWYPRNLDPIQVKVAYDNSTNWFMTVVGALMIALYPVSFALGVGELFAFILLLIIPITALFTDRLMITDEVQYYKNMDIETDSDEELITHEHLPDDGLYPFNTKRRAFLWSSVTASIVSVFMLFATQNLFTGIAFSTVILMPSMIMVQYLRKRSNMDLLAKN